MRVPARATRKPTDPTRLRRGVISAEDYTRACLERSRRSKPMSRPSPILDPEHALKQARALDGLKADGQRIGPLHGVPVGIKDIFDTADYPTEYGSPILARAVARMRMLLPSASCARPGRSSSARR